VSEPIHSILSRDLPQSPETEAALIACLLIDADSPDSTIGKVQVAGITAADFYDGRNSVVFREILRLQQESPPVTEWMLLRHLKTIGKLEEAGGQARIIELTQIGPTTAHAMRHIAQVKDLSIRRQLVTSAKRSIEQATRPDANTEEIMADMRENLDRLSDAGTAKPGARSLMELTATDEERRGANLLGNGFLRRGQGALLPGATGIGKSSLAMQALVLWALGKPFLGIKPQGPLTSLIVQAENDDIDLVEMRDGVCEGLALTASEREIVTRRVYVLTAHERGEKLMQRLESVVRKIKPDLLVLDPLFAFMEGAVKDQEAASYFLRALIQPFLVRHNLAAIILHHTNKPPTGKEKVTWQNNDFSYAGSGSSEFANWARAVILLRSIGKPDVFELMLPKRGKRAGICDAKGDPITSVMIRHAHNQGMIFWEPADAKDTRVADPKTRTPAILKAFYSLRSDGSSGVSLAKMASRLKVDPKTIRRDMKDGGIKTEEGEILVIRNSEVFTEDQT
jgi:hypothetical protein